MSERKIEKWTKFSLDECINEEKQSELKKIIFDHINRVWDIDNLEEEMIISVTYIGMVDNEKEMYAIHLDGRDCLSQEVLLLDLTNKDITEIYES